MDKTFCDLCGIEIEDKKPFENDIFIRIEHDTEKYNITDCCEECLSEFRIKFAKYIKLKKKIKGDGE